MLLLVLLLLLLRLPRAVGAAGRGARPWGVAQHRAQDGGQGARERVLSF
jgi:hypothetical protein